MEIYSKNWAKIIIIKNHKFNKMILWIFDVITINITKGKLQKRWKVFCKLT